MADTLPEDRNDTPDWNEIDHAPLDHAAMLKVTRRRLGLSQVATADLLGIPVANLRNWEQRRYQPDDAAKTLIRLFHQHPEAIRDWLTTA